MKMDDSSDKTISLLIPEEEEVTENVSVSPESTSSSSVDHECLICFTRLKKNILKMMIMMTMVVRVIIVM